MCVVFSVYVQEMRRNKVVVVVRIQIVSPKYGSTHQVLSADKRGTTTFLLGTYGKGAKLKHTPSHFFLDSLVEKNNNT